MRSGTYKLFAGNANPLLANAVCEYLDRPLSKADVSRFSDGEIGVEIKENVRGVDVFLIQSTSAPTNDHLMELLIMMDAFRRASAGSITAIIPYFGYARQDRKVRPRVPITAALVANIIEAAGADRVISIDMHAGQIQGFFHAPFDHLFAMPVMLDHMRAQTKDPADMVIVSPDAGGVERARAYSKRLDCSIAIVDKRRERANVSEVLNVIGDVEGKTALLLDDMIDTAGTLTNAAKAVREHGANRVVAYATHGVLSGPAIERLDSSVLEEIIITDTIERPPTAPQTSKLTVLSVAWLLGEAVRRVYAADSLSSLFV